MRIKVMYQNNETEMVEASQLDTLISSNKIKKFLRSEGGVTVGMWPDEKGASRLISLETGKDVQLPMGRTHTYVFTRCILMDKRQYERLSMKLHAKLSADSIRFLGFTK